MTNIMAKFMWKECRPDNREFRQNSSVLEPEDFPIGVPIPLTSQYLHNAEEILAAQLGSGNVDVPKPIYTNEAIHFALEYLGEYLRDPDKVSPDDFKQEPDDDWGDTSTEPTPVAGVDTEIDWSDNAEPSAQTKEVEEIWNENDGDPDEKWNDKEESWE